MITLLNVLFIIAFFSCIFKCIKFVDLRGVFHQVLEESVGLYKFTLDNASGFTNEPYNLFHYIKGMLELFNNKRMLRIGVGVPEMSGITTLITLAPFVLGNITNNMLLIIVSLFANIFLLYAQYGLEKATRDILNYYVKILDSVLRSIDKYQIDSKRMGTYLAPTEESLFGEYSFTITRILRFVDRN